MTNEEKFIAKSKMFRIHFQLSEDEIDLLLLGKNVVYKGVEAHDPELTLQLIEAYPFIYGLDHQKFQKDETTYPLWDDLPEATKS